MFRRMSALAIGAILIALVYPTIASSQARVTASQTTPVASAAYMKLGEIKGESVDAQHKEWIEVSSFSWGTSNSGRVGSDKRNCDSRHTGDSHDHQENGQGESCVDATLLCSQKAPEVVVHLPSSQRGQGYMEYMLKDVMISACTQANGQESLSFNYTKIEFKNAAVTAAPATR